MEYSTQRKIQSQQRNIIIWVNGLYFAELTERSTYDQKLIKKKSYLKLTLVKVKREKKKDVKKTPTKILKIRSNFQTQTGKE